MARINNSTLTGVLMAAMTVGVPTLRAHAAGTSMLTGNVASWVATAPKAGSAAADQRVSIVVHMALKDADKLKQVVAEVSKPGSPQYGRYLDTATFQARFAPDASDVSAMKTLLTNAGMTNVHAGSAGAYISAIATVAQLRSTFGVSQDLYKHGSLTLRANKEAPTLPASLTGKVTFIEGLDQSTVHLPMHVSVTQGRLVAPATSRSTGSPAVTPPPVASNAPPAYCDHYFGDLKATLSTKPNPYAQTMPWLNCGYTPQQIQAAYGIDKVTLDGSGVTVAIIDAYASPTIQADGNQYAANHNLPPLTSKNFSQIVPPGIYDIPNDPTVCGGEYGWWGEESLDLAAVHGSAPGAKIVYIGAADCDTSLTTALSDAIFNHTADVITNSYSYNGEEGLDPASVVSQDQTLMAAGAEGITVMFSSGDDGDLSQIYGVASGSYEATSPYATAIGGTTLGLYDSSGKKDEWGWGNYRDYLSNAMVNSGTSITTSGLQLTSAYGYTFNAFVYYSGAGGGISQIEPQPDYQASVVPTALATTVDYSSGYTLNLLKPQRVVPDVSMDADPYTGYLIGESFTVAGDPINDYGCTPKKDKSLEYCELGYGGTSLASPLMAGVIAIVDQQRLASGKPVVGFANPWLYGGTIGKKLNGQGINDVLPPTTPRSVLRGYLSDPTRVRVVTINSVSELINTVPFGLFVCGSTVCEGTNDVFNYTTPGYDTVTGLGVPYVPALINE